MIPYRKIRTLALKKNIATNLQLKLGLLIKVEFLILSIDKGKPTTNSIGMGIFQ
tara:strand:- start:3331 stop:3492 length:162 start_codon:yes stop_codon:yes gene_type:complete